MGKLAKIQQQELMVRLHRDFDVACVHFRLSPAARSVAWDSARARPGSAAACYRAIANSLGVTAGLAISGTRVPASALPRSRG